MDADAPPSGTQSPIPSVTALDSSTVSIAPLLVPHASNTDFYSTRNHPLNKISFRYLPCGPSPLSTPELLLNRVIPSPPANVVRFAWEDRSPYVYLSADAMSITSDKGFRSARTNVPIRQGTWYYEVEIVKAGGTPVFAKSEGAHIRIGVGRRESPLNAPVGVDGYSYGIRDRTGDKLHLSQPKQYGQSFTTGDVIGVILTLPPRPQPDPYDPQDPKHIVRKRVPIRYKNQLYFESLEYPACKEMQDLVSEIADPIGHAKKKAALNAAPVVAPGKRAPPRIIPPADRPLPKLAGSSLSFTKNGEYMGVAYQDIFDFIPPRPHPRPKGQRMSMNSAVQAARENHHDDGTLGYYPMVSVYGGGIAKINPGPNFAFAPPEGVQCRPLCERYQEYYDELQRYDEADDMAAIHQYRTERTVPPGLGAVPMIPLAGKKAGKKGRQAPKVEERILTPDPASSAGPSTPLPVPVQPIHQLALSVGAVTDDERDAEGELEEDIIMQDV